VFSPVFEILPLFLWFKPEFFKFNALKPEFFKFNALKLQQSFDWSANTG